ncbi:unnamed protein product [Allacma fusca]|uniref:t-SNARE coiled-coil homology domain-containing protein n=1 Tax=Allacma fusca TaxID=39272 RepID=A0A8J2PJB9_9HEXA|nr:unnamed protein product [Allacma fusca]
MDNLQHIRGRQDQVTNESLESTRRMRDLALETEHIGITTLDNLHSQGDQLDNIDRGLDKIGADLKTAEKQLNEMEKSIWRFIFCDCCGACSKKSGYNMHSVDKPDDTNIVQKPPGKRTNFETTQSQPSSGGGMQIARITNDAREDEMEENLDLTQRMLGNLRNMAIDMGDTVCKQNDQIDRLNDKTQDNNLRVTEAEKRTKALLKK